MFYKEERTLQQPLTIQKLPVNYKTLEEFKGFQSEELKGFSFTEDLSERLQEDCTDSPYIGIYFGNRLAGRMYIEKRHTEWNKEEPVLWIHSLEVLPEYRFRGLGSAMIEFLKEFSLPIQTRAFNFSAHFWLKMNFHYDKQTQYFYWQPKNDEQNTSSPLVC